MRWSPKAGHDIHRLYKFLEEKDPDAAFRAIEVIQAAARRLEHFPRLGRLMGDARRSRELFAEFGDGAYVLRYRIDREGHVFILRVWHSREER